MSSTTKKAILVLLLLGAVFLYWGRKNSDSSQNKRTLVVYGFSILADPVTDGILPAFQAFWKKDHHEEIEATSSFGGSGTITNQIVSGAPAQIALLSHELDAFRLESAGLAKSAEWQSLSHQGVINRTPFVIVTRPGNPLGIRSFLDLAKPGVKIIHPDPSVSGAAKWLILAEYGESKFETGSDETAVTNLGAIWRNIATMASSARGASTQFASGFGDALVTYEQDAKYSLQKGIMKGDVIYPKRTISSEHIAVRIDRNVAKEDADLVDAFLKFLWTDEAQKIFAKYHFRPVSGETPEGFPAIENPFYVKELGGWKEADSKIVSEVWQKHISPSGPAHRDTTK